MVLAITAHALVGKAQTSTTEVPMIGAEIFIEPGQTPEEIDTWFKRLTGMTVTRIRMFERYMHTPDGKWDFSLFDKPYKAGRNTALRYTVTYFLQHHSPMLVVLNSPEMNST